MFDFTEHINIKSTMLHIHLEKRIYRNAADQDFHVATAKTLDEESCLISAGYEFVHEYNGVMIYRKRR
jgi:hypothetical protein